MYTSSHARCQVEGILSNFAVNADIDPAFLRITRPAQQLQIILVVGAGMSTRHDMIHMKIKIRCFAKAWGEGCGWGYGVLGLGSGPDCNR